MLRREQTEDDFTKHIFTEIIAAIVFFMVLFIFVQQLNFLDLFKLLKIKQLQEYLKDEITTTFKESEYESRTPLIVTDQNNPLIQKIIMTEDVLRFPSGSDSLQSAEDVNILFTVGRILKNSSSFYEALKVEGHADSIRLGPSVRKKFPTNWELSAGRAITVVRFLTEKLRFDPKKISTVGFSSYQPYQPQNTTNNNRSVPLRLNRRIEFVIRYSYAESIMRSDAAMAVYSLMDEKSRKKIPLR